MGKTEKTVFISYRRSTSRFAARAIFMDLRQNGYNVFMDVESINSGEFERIILNQIAARAHFVLVLAPGSLDRTANPKDWLRREVEYAIKLQRNIVPVFVDDFSFSGLNLTRCGDVSKIPSFNGLLVPHDYFDEAMTRLRNRFLKQPLYGTIQPTPSADQATVSAKINSAAHQPEPTHNQLSASKIYNRAFKLRTQGAYQQALSEVNQAIALQPDFSEAYNLRGQCHNRLGNYALAISDYKRSLELGNPEPSIPYYGLGVVHGKLDDWKKALFALNESLRFDPSNAPALVWRAKAHEQVEDIDAAIADFEAYLALKTNDPSPPEHIRSEIEKLRSRKPFRFKFRP